MQRAVVIFLLLLSACSGIPEGVTPVSGFEVNRYLGKWYEIARLEHRFERGLTDVTAEYGLRDDGGVRVINSGYDAAAGERRSAEGRAYFVGAADVGQLEVSFWGPFFGAYNIVALDKAAYRYAMIVGNSHDYLWILARTPSLDAATLETLLAQARALGFATQDLIYPQTQP